MKKKLPKRSAARQRLRNRHRGKREDQQGEQLFGGLPSKSLSQIGFLLAEAEGDLVAYHCTNPWAMGVAKILEALRACLLTHKVYAVEDPLSIGVKQGRRRPPPARATVLNDVAAQLNRETGMEGSYSKGRLPEAMVDAVNSFQWTWNESCAVREGRAEWVPAGHVRPVIQDDLPVWLAKSIEFAIQSNLDQEGRFASLGRGDERVEKLAPVVAEVLQCEESGSARRLPGETHAERIVIACARLAGHPRPSAFLDRQRKREDRKYIRRVLGNS